MSLKSIIIILSYAVSKLMHYEIQCVYYTILYYNAILA